MILSCRDPRGASTVSSLRQVESYLKDTDMADLASAWVMAEAYLKDMGLAGLASTWAEDEGVPSRGGRGDALLRRMPPHLT